MESSAAYSALMFLSTRTIANGVIPLPFTGGTAELVRACRTINVRVVDIRDVPKKKHSWRCCYCRCRSYNDSRTFTPRTALREATPLSSSPTTSPDMLIVTSPATTARLLTGTSSFRAPLFVYVLQICSLSLKWCNSASQPHFVDTSFEMNICEAFL